MSMRYVRQPELRLNAPTFAGLVYIVLLYQPNAA